MRPSPVCRIWQRQRKTGSSRSTCAAGIVTTFGAACCHRRLQCLRQKRIGDKAIRSRRLRSCCCASLEVAANTSVLRSARCSSDSRHSGIIGIALALLMFTLQKMSSVETAEGGFPALCDWCGRRAVVPVDEGTIVGEHELRLAVWCLVCRSRRFARAANVLFGVRRKVDRRAARRDS